MQNINEDVCHQEEEVEVRSQCKEGHGFSDRRVWGVGDCKEHPSLRQIWYRRSVPSKMGRSGDFYSFVSNALCVDF